MPGPWPLSSEAGDLRESIAGLGTLLDLVNDVNGITERDAVS